MKSIMTFVVVTITLAAIASVFYGGYIALGYIWNLFDAIDSTLRLVLLSSFAVFLLGSFIIAGALKSAGQLKLKAQLTEAKISFYKRVVGLYQDHFAASQTGVKTSHKDIVRKMGEMNSEFSLLAGSSVIECHRNLEQSIKQQRSDDEQVKLYQQLIKKMRQDLGHTPNLDEARLKFLMSNRNTPKPGAANEVSA